MKKTEHFELNQWESTDRIMMEDFNYDNVKIDTALNLKGNCRIVHGTYTGDGHTYRSEPITLPGKPLCF